MIVRRLNAPWASVLLQEALIFLHDITGNGWRRRSCSSAARDAVVSEIVTETLNSDPEPAQLVVVPYMSTAISPDAASVAYAIDEERTPMAPLSSWNHVHQCLTYSIWDPTVCLAGYTWTERSVWLLQLDLHPLHPRILARQFRTIAAMMSAPASALIAVYIEQPIVQVAVACGLEVEFDCPFDQVAVEHGFEKAGVHELRMARFSHAWKRSPTTRELHMASLPHPLEDLDDFIQRSDIDFSLSSPPRTRIEDIQADLDEEEERKARVERALHRNVRARKLEKKKKHGSTADLRQAARIAVGKMNDFLATEIFSSARNEAEQAIRTPVSVLSDDANMPSDKLRPGVSELPEELSKQSGGVKKEPVETDTASAVGNATPVEMPTDASKNLGVVSKWDTENSTRFEAEALRFESEAESHHQRRNGSEPLVEASTVSATVIENAFDKELRPVISEDSEVISKWGAEGSSRLDAEAIPATTAEDIYAEAICDIEDVVISPTTPAEEAEEPVPVELCTDTSGHSDNIPNEKTSDSNSLDNATSGPQPEAEPPSQCWSETQKNDEEITAPAVMVENATTEENCEDKSANANVSSAWEQGSSIEDAKERPLELPKVVEPFRFSLYAPELPGGDEVFAVVIGNEKSLGEWNIAGAQPLHRNGNYISADAHVTDPPCDEEEDVEYKYALARNVHGALTIIAWEIGDNRVLRREDWESGGNVTNHVRPWQWVSQ